MCVCVCARARARVMCVCVCIIVGEGGYDVFVCLCISPPLRRSVSHLPGRCHRTSCSSSGCSCLRRNGHVLQHERLRLALICPRDSFVEESHQQQSLFGRERVKPHGWHEVGTPLSIDVRRCCLLCLLSIPKKVRSLSVSVSLSLSHSLSLCLYAYMYTNDACNFTFTHQ